MEGNPYPLYWDSTYALALALMEAHPQVDIEQVGLDELLGMIVRLPQFADDPACVTEAVLLDVMREWFEEASAR